MPANLSASSAAALEGRKLPHRDLDRPYRGPRGPPTSESETDAMSVETFCKRHGFSPQAFYKHRHLMPRAFNIGARVLITREAAAAWRAEREAAARDSQNSVA